jgi:hypothetical protein
MTKGITVGRVVQFFRWTDPQKVVIYLVSDEEQDDYSQGRVSLKTALRMNEMGLIRTVFAPLDDSSAGIDVNLKKEHS